MNAELTSALAATNLDDRQTHVWLDALTEAYQSQDGWDGFTLRLKTLADGELADATESFLRYADDHGRLDLVRDLVTTRQSPAEDHAAATDDTAPDTPWTRVVQLFGPGWAEWDGSETGWAQFRDWLYTAANEQDPDMYAAAYQQLDPLNRAPLDERVTRLRELGFTVTATAAPDTPSPWTRVVQQFGPGWAEWDGSETGWAHFRDWLYTAANEQDPDMYAAAYQQLDPLNHAPLDDRVTRLRELGFTVTAAAAPEEAGPAIPEKVLEQYPAEIQTMLTSEQGKTAIEEKQGHAAALLDEDPRFAEIDPQRRQELIMQVVAEQLAG